MTVALYIRVSTDEQAEQGFSLDVQKEKLILYCQSKGWDSYKLYIDDGYTGTNMERPALKRMLRHIEENKINSVLVYKLDRLSRKQKDILALIEDRFEKNNVAFNSHQENIDTSTPFGKAMLGVLAVFAQLDRDMIIERLTLGRRQRVKEGKWYGGRVPFGYSWNKDKQELEIVPEEARIVKEIFNMYLEGNSRLSIAEWVCSRVSNRVIDHNIIRDMLARPVYKGKFNNDGELVDGLHSGIIDEEIWERVQIEAKAREEGTSSKGIFLLTGLIKCGHCGGSVVHVKRTTKRGEKTYLYELYACVNQHRRLKDVQTSTKCKVGYLQREDLEQFVINKIKQVGLYPELLTTKSKKQTDDDTDNNEQLLEMLKIQLKEVNTGLENLYDAIQSGHVKSSAVSDRIKRLEDQRESLEDDIDTLIDSSPKKISKEDRYNKIKQIGKAWDYFTFEEQKTAIRTIIKTVIFNGKKAEPEIEWFLED